MEGSMSMPTIILSSKIGIKKEVQLSEWYLVAVSQAAKKKRSLIRLNVGSNTFGRATSNDVKLISALSSKKQCCLEISDADIVLTDLKSNNGTHINSRKLVNEREILCASDKIGFGCSPQNKFVHDINDEKHFVYQLKYGNPLGDGSIPFLITDSDDEENDVGQIPTDSKAESGISSGSDGHQTDDENQEGEEDEPDVKPDLASLLRQQRECVQQAALQREIKQEIAWNAHQYEKELNGLNNVEPYVIDSVEILDDSDDELICEPENKRKKADTEWSDFLLASPNPLSTKFQPIQAEYHPPPKHEISESILKEKVKLVRESRGQQLSDDLLKPNELLLNEFSHVNNRPSASNNYSITNRSQSKRLDIFDELLHHQQMNTFISDITKWDVKRITDREHQNTLEYHLPYCTSRIDLSFDDVQFYQKTMKCFTELELYSNIIDEFNRKSRTHQIFTQLLPGYKEEIRGNEKRFVFNCKAQKSDTKGLNFIRGDYAYVKHSTGHFLAFIFDVMPHTDHFRFTMESAKSLTNQFPSIKSKIIQVMPVINIRNTLECLYAIYKLGDSTLCQNVLQPKKNIYDTTDYDANQIDQLQSEIVPFINQEVCKAVYGFDLKIFTINGGIGTGKSRTVIDLLKIFISEESLVSDQQILVCGITNDLVDNLAIEILKEHRDIIRFSNLKSINNNRLKTNVVSCKQLSTKLTATTNSSKPRIVFATAHEAIDLLKNENCKFEICIVDDAALIPETHLLPLLRFDLKALVLVGDKKFRSPDMLSRCCCDKGFSRSLFGRIVECIDETATGEISAYPTLKVQYKMNKEIMMWPNKYFYKKAMIENQRPRIKKSPFAPLTVFKVNTLEDIEEQFLTKLLNFMVKKDHGSPESLSYGIICGNPKANASLNTLVKSTKNFNNIEISDYYCFQGKEKNVIIITALSPNDGFEILNSKENLMVALTRATDTLIVCGNFQHVTDVEDARARDEARENPMSTIWKDFLKDSDERHRLFDLDGEFNEKLVQNALFPR